MTTTYRFGLFELQPNQRRLLMDGRPVELGHRAFGTRGCRRVDTVECGTTPPSQSRLTHEDEALETRLRLGSAAAARAVHRAERVLRTFPDGVWYVDLAPLLDAERVALTVATALGVREEKERPIVDTLCERLAHQHTLLVLDNCEHLVAACAALVQRVIISAPGVRVMAASREGLGVPGERTVTVRSLSFPAPGSKHELPARWKPARPCG